VAEEVAFPTPTTVVEPFVAVAAVDDILSAEAADPAFVFVVAAAYAG
jgi:hypothetical protein